MKRTIFAVGSSAALLAGAWFAGAMLHPSVGKAITAVEMPAFVFPEVTVQGSQVPMLCASHMADGSVRTLIGLLDVADNSRSMGPLMPFTFGPHQGACVNLPVARPVTAVGAAMATAIPVIVILGSNESGGGGGAGKTFVASVQVRDEGGTRFVVTPSFMNAVSVPTTSPLP